MLTALAAIAMTGPAMAATVTYSSYTASGPTDASWVIADTAGGSANFGGSDTTFGGVAFEGNQTNGHDASETYVSVAGYNIYHSIPGSSWATNQTGYYPTAPALGLLNTGTFISGSGVTIDINGLTAGQEYLAKFVFANSNIGAENSTMTLTSGAGDTGSSGSQRFGYSDGQYLVVTARWVENGSGITFLPSINGGSGSSLNAVQIVAVPEPSSALFSAFAAFALFRRRR